MAGVQFKKKKEPKKKSPKKSSGQKIWETREIKIVIRKMGSLRRNNKLIIKSRCEN
jgi:hypothetical protein